MLLFPKGDGSKFTFDIWLPYPPTVNRYWRQFNGRTILSREARAYRKSVPAAKTDQPLIGDLAIGLIVIPPDRRRRDLDNIFKALFDAMQYRQYFLDDSQISAIFAIKSEPNKEHPGVWVGLKQLERVTNVLQQIEPNHLLLFRPGNDVP